MTDHLTPDPGGVGDPLLERRLRGALAVLADDVPPPQPPDLPRFASVRRVRRITATVAVLAAGVAVAVAAPAGWSALRPTPVPVAGPVEVAGVLTVTCTPTGVEVDAEQVDVSADGVHLRVVNRSGRPATWFSYSTTRPGGAAPEDPPGRYLAGQDGSVPVPGERTDLVVLSAPPRLVVGCSPDSGSQPTQQVDIRLQDPHGNFRRVDVAATLGCSPDEYPFTTGTRGRTMTEALAGLARGFPAPVQLLPGPGYRAEREARTYLAKGTRTRAMITVGPAAGGGYEAIASSFCALGSWKP